MSDALRQLEAGIAALEAQRAVLGDAVVDIALGPLRARLQTLSTGSRRTLRQVSILFLDIVGSTALSRRLDPEEIGRVVDGALTRATAIVATHGGRTLQYAGDNLLAAFGAVEAREDDAERAVRCGLALLELGKVLGAGVMASFGHADFDVRIGIHTGGVLLGGGVDEDNSIRGLAVNVAARMEQTAPAGALRISHDTYSQVRGVFDVVRQAPMLVKGFDAPVTSYLVERAKPRAFRIEARGIEGVATRMIGRDAELDRLAHAFERLVAPGAMLERVTVVAEAGIGKSRLLVEFRDWAEARAEPVFVLQARATPQTQGEPYGLLRDLFAWRLEIGDGDRMDVAKQKFEDGLMPLFVDDDGAFEAEAHVHLLGQLIGLDYDDSRHVRGIREDGRQIRTRGFHAAAQALRRFGRRDAPVIVYLDDLHWADDASLDFIDHLVVADRDAPMLIVELARPTLFERRPSAATADRCIDLQPLDRRDSRALADEILRKLPDIPSALRELIIGGADGNPYYMEELVRMLIDQRAIVVDDDDAWSLDPGRLLSLEVPPTLTGVLQARLDRLPRLERHALQLASVIGLDFWDAALAFVELEAAEQLPPLSKRALVRPKDGDARAADDIREYAFHHQILQQVTYDTVLRAARIEAHAKVAHWLATHGGARVKGLAGIAAGHFERAGDSANAAEYYARAAEHTAATFANEASLDYVARALNLAASDARELRWRLHASRERTLDLLGRRADQRDDIDRLLALAEALDDDAKRAEAAWRRCDFGARTSDWATTEREASRTRTIAARIGHEELELRALPRLAVAIAYRGDLVAARALAEAGLARAQTLGWIASQSRLANAVTICAELQRDRVAVLHFSSIGLALNRQSGDRRAETVGLCNVGTAYATIGDATAASRHLEEALLLSRALGNRLLEGNALGVLSEIAWRRGDGARALEHAEAAYAILAEVGSRHHQIDALLSLGNAHLALDRLDEATALFERGEAMGRELGQTGLLLDALDGMARAALARGDAPRALDAATRLLAAAGVQDADGDDPGPFRHPTRLTLHRVWSLVGDPRADAVLRAAHRALLEEADTISDAPLRACFLDDIPEHRQIVTSWSRFTMRAEPASTDEDSPS